MTITDDVKIESVNWRVDWDAVGVVPPFGGRFFFREVDGRFTEKDFTKAQWEQLQWNPPAALVAQNKRQGVETTDPDPDATPLRPSWETVVKGHWHYLLGQAAHSRGYNFSQASRNHLRATTDDAPIEAGEAKVQLGDGINHMTGLVHVADAAAQAGARVPAIVMRQPDGSPLRLHTQREVRALLGAVADRENRIESAHNLVAGEFARLAAIADDAGQDLADRLEASRKAEAIFQDYATHHAAALAKVDTTALPADLPRLREKLIEFLEAAATGQQKRIKGALSQQAIDNWAACVEIDQALREVALECAVGAQRIGNASDPAKAKAAFSAAVTAVEAVSPVNIPEVTHAIAGRRVTIRAVNPTADPAIRGPVTVLSTSVASTDGSTITGKVTASDGLPVKDPDPRLSHWDFADDYGGKVRIAVEVRNVCGPATHEVDLEVTANGGIRVA